MIIPLAVANFSFSWFNFSLSIFADTPSAPATSRCAVTEVVSGLERPHPPIISGCKINKIKTGYNIQSFEYCLTLQNPKQSI